VIARPSLAARKQLRAAIASLVDAAPAPGTLAIYDGPMPRSPEDAVNGDQTLLVSLDLANPAFGASSNGAMGLRQLDQRRAVASGTARWARISDGSGKAVMDIDVGLTGAALNLTSTRVFERGPIVINALVLRMPAA